MERRRRRRDWVAIDEVMTEAVDSSLGLEQVMSSLVAAVNVIEYSSPPQNQLSIDSAFLSHSSTNPPILDLNSIHYEKKQKQRQKQKEKQKEEEYQMTRKEQPEELELMMMNQRWIRTAATVAVAVLEQLGQEQQQQ